MSRSLFLLCALLCITAAEAQTPFSRLQSLLDQKDYFRLKTALEEESTHLRVEDKAYFQAFVDNVFARNDWSLKEVRALLETNSLTGRQRYGLWLLQEDNYYKLGQYRMAVACCDTLLRHYEDMMDAVQRVELANDRILWHALEDVPPQEVFLPASASVSWTRDVAGLMNVPVRIDTATYNFVFDTGAGLSTISESFAARLGLHIREAGVDVQGSTGQHNTSSLAVADSLFLGDVLLRHVVFLVLPDAQLTFPPIHYSIKAILGLPVIWQLQEIHILRDGELRLERADHPGASNLALDGWAPVVSVITRGDTLSFHFDTGASNTDLYSPYLERHREEVLREGKRQTSRRGGAGGIVATEVYRLKNVDMEVGGRPLTLPQVDVLTHSTDDKGERYYGNLGQDVFSRFPEMVLNFKYMYLQFP
ncbi:retropepsin-like aspartic protease [Dinghuibacter silviterrae]|nr:retropepsin-like aspartic protease [Dinghuibacter silviterrae]